MEIKKIRNRTKDTPIDLTSAAFQAGYSTRHFRRIIEEDGIPVTQMGEKRFIFSRDLAAWKETKGEYRLDQAIHQLDIWIKRSASDPFER